jgi:hypothetical protein
VAAWRVRYRVMRRAPIVAGFVMVSTFAAGLLIATVTGGSDGPPMAFTVAWLAAFAWKRILVDVSHRARAASCGTHTHLGRTVSARRR